MNFDIADPALADLGRQRIAGIASGNGEFELPQSREPGMTGQGEEDGGLITEKVLTVNPF